MQLPGRRKIEDVAGKEYIIGHILPRSHMIFVREYPMSIFIRNELETAYRQKWPVNFICRLALFESLSRDKDLSEEQFAMEQEILQKCMKKDLQFAFFRRLPAQLKTQYQLDDKTFVEYHTDPAARVTLYYALDGLHENCNIRQNSLHNI